jgi:hypothetical protein
MANLKYFDSDTNTWKTLVVGAQGPQGIQGIQGETGSGPVNAIINGGFDIWQRGTSFTNPASNSYTADRFQINYDGVGATRNYTRESFTPGEAPQVGYEGEFFFRYARTVAGSGATVDFIRHKAENVRTFANTTATLSFWAKAGSGTPTLNIKLRQNFGSGGSTSVDIDSSVTLSTSWQRFSVTVNVPSISGKTVAFNSGLDTIFAPPLNTIQTIDIWGVQLEAGSTATPFRRNANSLQGELAACQRYYQRFVAGSTFGNLGGFGWSTTTTSMNNFLEAKTTLRAVPTSIDFGGSLQIQQTNNNTFSVSNITLNSSESSTNKVALAITHASATANLTGSFRANSDANAFVGFSAEL